MPHRQKTKSHHGRTSKSREWLRTQAGALNETSESEKPKLEIVLKCDSPGSVEAVTASVLKIAMPEVDIQIIHSGVGSITKSDILIAETGSRLIVGFQTDVLPGIDKELKEHGVDARLYDVIYTLTADIKSIAESMIPDYSQDEITGTGKIIALFKSSRKGIIIGCEVRTGSLSVGKHFRIISAMGPVYSGTIESIHIENTAVQKVRPGQQAGIKIRNFKRARIGDIVECFRPAPAKNIPSWRPQGRIIHPRA